MVAILFGPQCANKITTPITFFLDELEIRVKDNDFILTYWGQHKMAAILQKDIFKFILLDENYSNLIQIQMEVVPDCPINKWQALVQIIAWCQAGDKPLSEPMMAEFTNGYKPHSVSMD